MNAFKSSRLLALIKRMVLFFAASILVAAFTGCQSASLRAGTPWKQKLAEELPVMGHRNWIVIADSAYPAQSGAGIETIYTGEHQLDAVHAVLDVLDRTRHVQPIVHLDAELPHVPESLAPGVGAYRADLDKLLQGRRVVSLPHAELIDALDVAGKKFHILILKTDLTIPYTTVFLELDCAYWGPEPEKKLREALQNH